MKRAAAVILLYMMCSSAFGQAGMWTWMRGSNTLNSVGTPGVKGVPSSTNEPRSRYACGQWVDTAGNFWIYGGVQPHSNFGGADLWMFDPLSNIWTWRGGLHISYHQYISAPKGVYHPDNYPGALRFGMFCWTTADNHLWLFGGTKANNEINDDLWQYDPAIDQWAWMGNFQYAWHGNLGQGDATTRPGGRHESNTAWTDSIGNLWLFGGERFDGNHVEFSDMWKYERNTGIWTWMSGSSWYNSRGSYGTLGVPSKLNYPSSRLTNLFWKDYDGNFWLAGGGRFPYNIATTYYEMYQDVWKFNPNTLEWTWMKGPSVSDTSGSYGSYCHEASFNKMGARYENRCVWKVCSDLIINYGGFSNMVTYSAVNELWAYHPTSNNWERVWWGPPAGHYGTKGVRSIQNAPPIRSGAVGFVDRNGNAWMFGGIRNSDSGGILGYYNDLWKYEVDTSCVGTYTCPPYCQIDSPQIAATIPITSICSGDSIELCAPSGYTSYRWNNYLSGRCIQAKAAGNYYVSVMDKNNCGGQSNRISLSVFPPPSVSVLVNGDTLSSFGASSYQWYLNGNKINGATSAVYIANEPGRYTLEITDANGCTAMSTPVLISGIDELEQAAVSIYPNPASMNNVQLTMSNSLVGSNLEVFDANGRLVFFSKLTAQSSQLDLPLSKGVYFIRIHNEQASVVKRWVRL